MEVRPAPPDAFEEERPVLGTRPMERDRGWLIPWTLATRVGYACLLFAVPLAVYKIVHRITGRPIDYMSHTVVVLGAMALLGIVVGCSILGIAVIRSAFRD